uniref:Uncharacterized protein n=1 Tax=Rhizophora mucronata TaxID=61149 RepID=A0A2P2MXK7_RHIMU
MEIKLPWFCTCTVVCGADSHADSHNRKAITELLMPTRMEFPFYYTGIKRIRAFIIDGEFLIRHMQ